MKRARFTESQIVEDPEGSRRRVADQRSVAQAWDQFGYLL
jgi:hypothetical protein